MLLPHVTKFHMVYPRVQHVGLCAVQSLTRHVRWAIGMKNGRDRVTMKYGGIRKKLEHCMELVASHCPVETWPQTSPEANRLQNLRNVLLAGAFKVNEHLGGGDKKTENILDTQLPHRFVRYIKMLKKNVKNDIMGAGPV